ncbi:MAG: hypothetical protein LAT79_18815 [Kiritimatiellae bacterium]|nr:hypothetical protein [Kiritimatiellia bacterium]
MTNERSANRRIGGAKGGLFFLFTLLLLSACSRPPEPRFPEPDTLPALQARVSTGTPRVGDIIEVNLRLTAEDRLVLPAWSELLHEDVNLLDQRTPSATRTEAGLWQQEAELRVALYTVTNATLFADDSAQTRNDPPRTLNLPFIALTVEALTGEDDDPSLGNMDLMDFRGSEALRRARRNRWLSLLGLLLLLAILYWIHRRVSRRPAPPPPPLKWDKIALRKMEELRSEAIWIQADADASAVALSDILREYIEGRFNIHAPDLTTEEFLIEASERQPWSDTEQTELEGFFRAVDRIKFAAERPGAEALTQLMQAAERFVRVTGTGGAA